MNKNISEEELLLRKRARRRLVGAIVLVIISVIVLPIIFDEPKPENEEHEIAINLPASPKNNRNNSVSLPKEELIDQEAFDKVDSLPELQARPNINQQNIKEETTEMLGEQKRTPIPGIKPKIEKHPIEPKNIQITNNADATKGFVVQLGAFSDQLKAKQQHANLVSNGFKAYTEVLRIDNNEVTRVRIGPFMTKGAAENELKKLKKLGLDGVVTPR